MNDLPLIGVTGSRYRGDKIVGNIEVLADSPIDVFYADYAQGIIEAGGFPVHLPLDVDPAAAVERLDGLLLTGGTDVDPRCYGAEPAGELWALEPERDAFELALLEAVADRALPTAGVCRGLQILNVHAGGTLHQHVPVHTSLDPLELLHEVEIEPDSMIAAIYGSKRSVNSLHHQAAADVGDGLRVVGRSPDGGVEAVEHRELPIVAVQWHPEMLPSRPTDPLFRWLVEQATGDPTADGGGSRRQVGNAEPFS